MQNLPKIDEDPLYQKLSHDNIIKRKIIRVKNISDINLNKLTNSLNEQGLTDKHNWFSENKDNNNVNQHSGVNHLK